MQLNKFLFACVIVVLSATLSFGEDEALKAIRKDAQDGDAEAQYRLARAYIEEETDDFDEGNKKAIFWLHKAADQGHSEAQFELGAQYEDQPREALKWYLKAAEGGNKEVPYFIGLMYYENKSVRDYAKAAEWFSKSDDERAYYFLGLMYEKGQGVKQDREKAIELLKKSAKQGCDIAKEELIRRGIE